MSKNKDFFVYQVKPEKDDKKSNTAQDGTTEATAEDSGTTTPSGSPVPGPSRPPETDIQPDVPTPNEPLTTASLSESSRVSAQPPITDLIAPPPPVETGLLPVTTAEPSITTDSAPTAPEAIHLTIASGTPAGVYGIGRPTDTTTPGPSTVTESAPTTAGTILPTLTRETPAGVYGIGASIMANASHTSPTVDTRISSPPAASPMPTSSPLSFARPSIDGPLSQAGVLTELRPPRASTSSAVDPLFTRYEPIRPRTWDAPRAPIDPRSPRSLRGFDSPYSSARTRSGGTTEIGRYNVDDSAVHIFRKPSPSPSLCTLGRELKNYINRRDSNVYQYYPGTESTDYDYVAERCEIYSTNLVESTAHLIKGSIGAGVLSMHEAYKIGGMWTSLVVTVAVGLVVAYVMFMLIRSAQKLYHRLRISKLSYPDLAEAAAATAPWPWVRKSSKAFRYIVDISLFLEMCGTCCIYQIIIAYTLKQICEGINPELLFDKRIYILMSAPILIPLCLIRSLKLLAPFAMLSDVFVALCVFTTLYYSLLTLDVHIEERAPWTNADGFIRMFGVCMYSTAGICVALPVENNMRSPRYFPHAVGFATFVVILLSILTGVFGYWAWGEECRSPITIHMPVNILTIFLQFLLIIMLSTTFAVQFWVPFRIVWHYIMRKHKSYLTVWERFYRFFMAISIIGMSMVFPNLLPVMMFLGLFFLGLITLIFPACIEFLVDWEEYYTKKIRVRFYHDLKNFSMVLLGLLLTVAVCYSLGHTVSN